MDRLLRGGQLQSMKLGLILTAVEVETEKVVETDGAEVATNHDFLQVSMRTPAEHDFGLHRVNPQAGLSFKPKAS
jgi:hypothetical protein